MYYIYIYIYIYIYCFIFEFLKLWKYDNTFTGKLENAEQGYIEFHCILQLFLSK